MNDLKALQDENAEMALKLAVAQRENELMRLELGREKADRQLGDVILNEQLDKENNEKLEMADGDAIPSEFVGGSQEFAKTTKALEVENMKTDLLSRDAVVVKGVAAAVVGKSHAEVASVSAIPGSSSAADEFDSESTERGGKDSLKTQEVVLMVDEFQALQDEIADITLKLEISQKENELMRLELG